MFEIRPYLEASKYRSRKGAVMAVMSTKSVCDISCGAMHEFALALDRAGFNANIVQRIVSSKDNASAKAMYAVLRERGEVDDQFHLLASFPVVVPDGYDHATRLDTFLMEHGGEFSDYDGNLTDENFAGASTKLVPGQKFTAKIFQMGDVNSVACFDFMASIKSVLVGAQGITLAYEQGKEHFPISRSVVSLDDWGALWNDGRCLQVPVMGRHTDRGCTFYLYDASDNLYTYCNNCLLCFCEEKNPS